MEGEPDPIPAEREAAARAAEPVAAGLTRGMIITCVLVGLALVAWFFFAWLGLRRNIVDAAGEAVGSAILLLVLLSVGGAALRRGP